MSCKPSLLAILMYTAGLLSPAGAAELVPGWAAVIAGSTNVQVTIRPAALAPGQMTGLKLRGAWTLTADRPEFGGFSGLVVRDGRIYAVSDRGWWMGAELLEQDGTLALRDAVIAPIRGPDGHRYDSSSSDAEGLTLNRGRLMVAFERNHRVLRLNPDGLTEAVTDPGAFQRLRTSKGIEALASLPDDRMIGFAEERDGANAPVFVIDSTGNVTESVLPVSWLQTVTGADMGPDNRLYLVLREFSALFGLSIQVMRYGLGDDDLPLPESSEILAKLGQASGIGNMEGLSLEARPDGSIRLWMISDNNFADDQNTILAVFDVIQ